VRKINIKFYNFSDIFIQVFDSLAVVIIDC